MRARLQISGNHLTEGSRPVRLMGVNMGNWMQIEHYMIGLPWVEYQMRAQARIPLP